MEIEGQGGLSEKAKEDLILVNRAKEKDEKAYEILLKRYKGSVYHLILKMIKNTDDSEDLTIEVFAKAFINLPRYNPEYAFSTWLFRIATNHSIDFIRKKRIDTTSIDNGVRSDKTDEVFEFQISDKGLNPHEHAIRNQKIELMRRIVSNMPERYQELVRLRYFQELSYEEIAEQLDIPIGTVKAQLHRSRELLYDVLKNRKDSI